VDAPHSTNRRSRQVLWHMFSGEIRMKKLGVILFAADAILVSGRSAFAIPAFLKEYMAKYVDPSGDDEFIATAKKVKCNICHEGDDKKKRNAYGEALDPLLDKKADAKAPDKIQAALDKVGAMKSDPKNDGSPTWDELFKGHKLPGAK
jgi:hypothetical protein